MDPLQGQSVRELLVWEIRKSGRREKTRGRLEELSLLVPECSRARLCSGGSGSTRRGSSDAHVGVTLEP